MPLFIFSKPPQGELESDGPLLAPEPYVWHPCTQPGFPAGTGSAASLFFMQWCLPVLCAAQAQQRLSEPSSFPQKHWFQTGQVCRNTGNKRCETFSNNQFIKDLKTLHTVKHEKPSTDEINVSVTTVINADVSARKKEIWRHQQFTRLLIFNSSFSEASLTPAESKFSWNSKSATFTALAVRPELPF